MGSIKKKADDCWNFNKGLTCKFGKKCRFIERCSYCDSPSHGISTCNKLEKKDGGRRESSVHNKADERN